MQNEVIEFIAEFTGTKKSEITLDTLVNDDLGVDGDEGSNFLLEFSTRFNVDLSAIDKVYFGPEGFNPFTILFQGVSAFWAGCLVVQILIHLCQCDS